MKFAETSKKSFYKQTQVLQISISIMYRVVTLPGNLKKHLKTWNLTTKAKKSLEFDNFCKKTSSVIKFRFQMKLFKFEF